MWAPPRALARIREAFAAEGVEPALEAGAGAFLRTLAASKPGGVLLQAGAGSAELAAWLIDGMDITTRLIVVVPGREPAALVEREVGDDLRVAVHRQDPLEFLADIRAHRLQMIVFDQPPPPELAAAALELVAPGGLLASCQGPGEGARQAALERHLRTLDAFHSTPLALGSGLLVAARRANPPPTTRRRRRG